MDSLATSLLLRRRLAIRAAPAASDVLGVVAMTQGSTAGGRWRRSEAGREGVGLGRDDRRPDVELDHVVRAERDGARITVHLLPVDERGDRPGQRADLVGPQRLMPDIEKVPEREGSLHGGLDVDHAALVVGMQPIDGWGVGHDAGHAD